MSNDYTIDAVAFHTQRENVEGRDQVLARFRALAGFLDENKLTRTPLSEKTIDDSFAVRTSDLTDEGRALMKGAYESWLGGIERGKSPEDVTRLKKELAKIRKK